MLVAPMPAAIPAGSFAGTTLTAAATAFTMLMPLWLLGEAFYTHRCTGGFCRAGWRSSIISQILYLLNVKDSRWAGLNPGPKRSPKHLHFWAGSEPAQFQAAAE